MESRRADVVIIGGGVVGLSAAYHLGRRGGVRVVLLERDRVGQGTTSRCAGGIRQQFSTEVNIRFSQEGLRQYQRFRDEVGEDPGLVQCGYAVLARTAEEVALFEQNLALQRRLGVPASLLGPAELSRLLPFVRLDGVVAGSYCATDGMADPARVTAALAQAAGRLGVEILEQAEVVEIQVERGAVRGVRTRRLEVAAPCIVNAAGTWSGLVAQFAGTEAPIVQAQRQLYVTGPVSALPPSFPLIVDYHHGWYGRREGMGVLVSGALRATEGFSLVPDPAEAPRALQEAAARIPALKGAKVVRAWVGIYDNTPDNHAILGETPEVRGLYIAAGFSGHGFMHGPAAGRVMAELIVEGKATLLDITPLRPERFREGRLTQEPLTMHR